MILKLGSQFGKDFENYRNSEDEKVKSEVGFMEYLKKTREAELTRAQRNKRFRSYLYNSILEDEDNKAKPLVSTGNRSSNTQPLTVDMLSKSLFASFLYGEPVGDNMATDAYKREYEFKNNVRLLNVLYGLGLVEWNAAAPKGDTKQNRLGRMFSSKSIMAWSELFRDAVCAKLDLVDGDDKAKPFYRELSDDDFGKIRKIAERLFAWSMWMAPVNSDIDTAISGNKSALKKWFKEKGLTVAFLMGINE
jgi:hypothetical protein